MPPFILFAGITAVFLRDKAGAAVPLPLLWLFVKINKSFVLLVLFVAGHSLPRFKNPGAPHASNN
jgi:hypothetical protein